MCLMASNVFMSKLVNFFKVEMVKEGLEGALMEGIETETVVS